MARRRRDPSTLPDPRAHRRARLLQRIAQHTDVIAEGTYGCLDRLDAGYR
jgi:hypothetical protein